MKNRIFSGSSALALAAAFQLARRPTAVWAAAAGAAEDGAAGAATGAATAGAYAVGAPPPGGAVNIHNLAAEAYSVKGQNFILKEKTGLLSARNH